MPRLKTRSTKPKLISTVEIEESIARKFGIRQNIIVPNLSWGFNGMHECDVFIVKKSGYCVEVEIKRSKSDLLADGKKGHHHIDNRIKELYFAIPVELLESCEALIPKHAGIITCSKTKYSKFVHASIHRSPVANKKARKITIAEQLKVASLGCMRVWRLKEKLIALRNERTKV